MTAKKFKVGDAVRWIGNERANGLNNKSVYIVDEIIDEYFVWIEDKKINCDYKVPVLMLEPYGNTQYCRYCGVEIVIEQDNLAVAEGVYYTVDTSEHDIKCPLNNMHGYRTEQEAIDAYSMKGEG